MNLKKLQIKNLLVGIALMLSASLFAQDKTEVKAGVFQFETEIIDYGTITENADGERTFKFKNVGTAPIIIANIKTSCGCTVPTKPKTAVLPGETGEIGVKYATNRIGAFSKSITVMSNASENAKILKIKGKVEKGKVSSL